MWVEVQHDGQTNGTFEHITKVDAMHQRGWNRGILTFRPLNVPFRTYQEMKGFFICMTGYRR